jgi:hypothetical protein
MKAKLYTQGTAMEVRVSNKSYASIENENKKAFLKRVNLELEKDFDEAIDIVEVSQATIEKLDDQMIVEVYKISKGLQEAIICEILKVRGIEFEKIEKTVRKKIEKVDIETVKASDEYKAAKANVGKLVQYTPAKSEEVVKGIIKSISLNKTNTIIYYNVQCGTVLRCCTANNATLLFFEF